MQQDVGNFVCSKLNKTTDVKVFLTLAF